MLGTLLLAYGAAEMIEGYGFIAVFVGAVTARQRENASRYHRLSHHFIDQIENIVLVAVLLAFGGMLADGVLDALTWPAALIGLALILVIRPISALAAEWFSPLPWPGTVAVAFLGIRGMGSIYYLAYGQNSGEFAQIDLLWATVSFTILASIVIHGVSAGRLIEFVEARDGHVHKGESTDYGGAGPRASGRRPPATDRCGKPPITPLRQEKRAARRNGPPFDASLIQPLRPSWQVLSWRPASWPGPFWPPVSWRQVSWRV